MDLIMRALETLAPYAPAVASVLVAITGVASALFWPLAVVFIVWTFRKPLAELIGRVEKVDTLGVQIQANLQQVEALVEQSQQADTTTELTLPEAEDSASDRHTVGPESVPSPQVREDRGAGPIKAGNVDLALVEESLARVQGLPMEKLRMTSESVEFGLIAPMAGLLTASNLSEKLLWQLAVELTRLDEKADRVGYMSLGKSVIMLRNSGVIGAEWVRAWRTLQKVRNEVAQGGASVGSKEVLSWIESALKLIAQAQRGTISKLHVMILEAKYKRDQTED
jgi:hypothetical protein